MRIVARVLFATYLVVVAVIVLNPTSGLPTTSIWRIAGLTGLDYDLVQAGTNVLLFVPMTLLGPPAWNGPGPLGWLALAVGVAVGVELVQSMLPDRTPSPSDVLLNGTGAVLGLLLGQLVAAAGRRSSSGRGSRPRRRPGAPWGRAGS